MARRLLRRLVRERYTLAACLASPAGRARLMMLRRRERHAWFALGDSHAEHTFAGMSDVLRLHVGPVTMHRIGRDGLGGFPLFGRGCTLWPRTILRPGDDVLFCFGEIDCRCHIARQVLAGRREEEVIAMLAASYVRALSDARREGVRFWIVSVTPPASAEILRTSPLFTPSACDADRARYTRLLNEELCARAEREDFGYLDLSAAYADAQGMLRRELSDGTLHIGDTGAVRDILNQLSFPLPQSSTQIPYTD